MKEAAGEANMTVITIVLIGLVAAAGAILIPQLLTNMNKRSACSEMGGDTVSGTTCKIKSTNKSVCTLSQNANKEWVCQ